MKISSEKYRCIALILVIVMGIAGCKTEEKPYPYGKYSRQEALNLFHQNYGLFDELVTAILEDSWFLENGNVYLEMTIDESFAEIKAETVDTKRLGMTRISEASYENPDGSPITIDSDIFGNARGKNPTTGPIENIGTGRVKILVAKTKAK